ncbi:Uncharacterised protein [Vibrio cholerae]|uniref:Uncharacterized protein n=1 Tax=Vibrio cholerae TaxID=666 RepID=A0A656AHD6_VIBCL|nr:Uncharacterised protein [Vibrio cholerae]CSD09324.1 Uncharacterised protein [Vibrio cholerae]
MAIHIFQGSIDNRHTLLCTTNRSDIQSINRHVLRSTDT